MYRNDRRLTQLNKNCDISIRLRTTVCRMNDDRQIAAESLTYSTSKPVLTRSYWTDLHHIFTGCKCIRAAINACI